MNKKNNELTPWAQDCYDRMVSWINDLPIHEEEKQRMIEHLDDLVDAILKNE